MKTNSTQLTEMLFSDYKSLKYTWSILNGTGTTIKGALFYRYINTFSE